MKYDNAHMCFLMKIWHTTLKLFSRHFRQAQIESCIGFKPFFPFIEYILVSKLLYFFIAPKKFLKFCSDILRPDIYVSIE